MGLAAVSRKKVFLGAVLLLLIAFFLPPNINAARFKSTLAPALSAALGREVRIGAVHFRLLPRPGFDLHDFKVMDDPAFSPEPLLQCGEVTADVRLRSLWQGRLEIANLRLRNATDQAPPSLNLVYRNGHWNLESLLARAGQASTAPTATKHAEQRLRFPYVAATGGRINVKIGMEKKPYALMDTDFELLLAAEERWHFLLEGRPVRTDMNLGDTGTIKLEGDLSHLRDLPHLVLNLNASWKNAQLGQLSSLVLGQDKGWRGTLALSAQLTGSPNHMQLTTDVTLRNPRRYDINRSNIPPLDVTCLGDYTETSLGFKCNSTLGTGEVVLSGNLAPPIRQNYDISLAARNVPLASMAAILRQVKRTVPDDVTATGDINATFNFRSADGQKEWVGDGATTDFAVRSSAGAAPFQVSPVKFHMGSAETEPGRKQAKTRTSKRKTAAVTSPPDTLTIDPFAVRMSEDAIAQVHGWIDHHGYLLQARGAGAQLESVLELGQTSGFQRRVGPITGKVDFDVQMSGPWAGFAPPVLTGKARVQGVKYAIPGIKDPLRLAAAEVELTEEAFTLNRLNAHFEGLATAITGSVTSPRNCPGESPCPLQFDLHADNLGVSDVARVLGLRGEREWNLPFFSSSTGKLPVFRASGTLSTDEFRIAQFPVQEFSAHVEVGDRSLLINEIKGRTAGGTTTGEWRVDWSTPQLQYRGTGRLDGVTLDRAPVPAPSAMLSNWIAGKSDIKYALHFEGKNGTDILSSAGGQIDLSLAQGASRALALGDGSALKFTGMRAALVLNHQLLTVSTGKFKAAGRIYDISGTVSLGDKLADIKITGSGSGWKVTGALDAPEVTAQPVAARKATTHSQ